VLSVVHSQDGWVWQAYYAVAVYVARAVLYAAPYEGLCHTDSVRLSYMVNSGCSVWSIKV
jgi:hypothetical protein